MAIYINGRFLIKKLTGIQRYAMEVLKQFDDIKCDENIILLVPQNIIYDLKFKKIKIECLKFFNDNLWEQISIPLYLLGKKNAKLINLFNSAPILNPGYTVIHDISFKTCNEHLTKKFILWYSFLNKMNIKRYKHIFTVSEFSKKEIMDVYNIASSKITVTYNSAEHIKNIKPDTDILKRLKIEGKQYCFSVGSKSKHKNRKYIVDCAKKNPDILFVISGSINTKVLIDQEEERLDNLIVTGYITDNELVTLYKNCECFIFPSLYEGFGIPPLEAITCGAKKILVSDLPVFKEVYGNNVNYIDYNSEAKYNIKNIFENGIKSDECILNKYSWKEITQKIYNNIIKE